MTKVEVTTSNNANVDVVVATPQPMTPSTATPLDIGLVEISSIDQYIPGPVGPVGPQGPPGPQGSAGPIGPAGAADEIFIGPNDPGTGGTWEFWFDTDAPAISGGGGGISPPPSDGGEYVYINGAWRLKSQSFVMDGLAMQVVQVPAGARMVRITGSAYPLIGNGVTAHVSVDGTTMVTSNYFWGGYAFNTGTDGVVNYGENAGSSAMFITGTANMTTRPHTFTAEMNLLRADTTKTFSLKCHGICHSDLANRLLRTTLFNNWLDPTVTPALSLKAFELVSGSTWGAGSFLEVVWIY